MKLLELGLQPGEQLRSLLPSDARHVLQEMLGAWAVGALSLSSSSYADSWLSSPPARRYTLYRRAEAR